jgi:two-component system cell cycle response regulator PopA
MDDVALNDSDFQSKFQILIVTDDLEAAKTLIPACSRKGQDLTFCAYNGKKLRGAITQTPDAILMLLTDYIEHAPQIKQALSGHFKGRTLPYIGALFRQGRFDVDDIFDSIIYAPAHPSQISQRVEAVLRLQRMEREIIHRVETYKEDFGVECDFSLDAINRPFNILFVGKATPAFMSILNALQEHNVSVTGAFSSYSAFNYLHEHEFDAVVMNAIEDSAPSILVTETMRRNSRLYDIPVIFLTTEDPDDVETIYAKGVHDIIQDIADLPEIRGRILEAANFHRLHAHMKKSLKDLRFDECTDLASRLFNKEFLICHLTRVVNYCQTHNYNLSLIALKVQANALIAIEPDRIAQAENQIGGMIRTLLRQQDISARISEDTFILAFPEQSLDRLDPILERITGIVDCAAFDAGYQEQSSGTPFTMTIDAVKVGRMAHETAHQVLTNAIAELTDKHVPLSLTG